MDELPPDVDGDQQPTAARETRRRGGPASTLSWAMVVYIFINLLFALPLVILPVTYFDAIGLDERTAGELGGLRWVGAVLLAWAISGILVLASPGGRAFFVTSGAFQLTFAALAFLYSWSVDEYRWSVAYQALATVLLSLGAIVMWWARFAGRRVFRQEVV